MEIEVSRATLVTGPATEPITLTQAKKQLELSPSDTAHDDHLTLLIQTAREQWEHDTDSACLTQTWSVNLEYFCDDEIYLPKRPIQSITSITYYDGSSTQQILSTDIYSLDSAARAVRLKYQQIWPTTVERWDAITVTYVCGYTSSSLVPAAAKQAMLLLVGKYFENRDLLTNDVIYKDETYEALVRRFMRSSYP